MQSHNPTTTVTGVLSAEEAQTRTAVLWTLVALGLLLHNVLHIFSYVAELARATQDPALHKVAIFDVGSFWGYAVSLTLVVLPALVSFCGKGKGSAWGALLLGAFLVFMNAGAGWYHGIHDGTSYLLDQET